MPRKREKEGQQEWGQKGKRTRENRSVAPFCNFLHGLSFTSNTQTSVKFSVWLSWDHILPPPPTPDFLSKDFCLQPGRDKSCSHCNFQEFHSLDKGNEVSLLKIPIHFSHPELDGKSADIGGGCRIGILSCCFAPPSVRNLTPCLLLDNLVSSHQILVVLSQA